MSYNEGYNPYDDRLVITRLAPVEGRLTFEWVDYGETEHNGASYAVMFRETTYRTLKKYTLDAAQKTCSFDGFTDGIIYSAYLVRKAPDGEMSYSRARLFRTGKVYGTVINYNHPLDKSFAYSGFYTGSPCIARLPSGRLLASHDIAIEEQCLTKVFYSDDDGASWHFATDIHPCKWGKLFVHRDRTYMLAVTGKSAEDLIIFECLDNGFTWTKPTVILCGKLEPEGPGGMHKAPVPVVEHKGRIWTAVERHIPHTERTYTNGVISAPADSDLLNAANWVATTPFLEFDTSWPNLKTGGSQPKLIEGNVVVMPDGGLINLIRYNQKKGIPGSGRAVILKVDIEHPQAPLAFDRVIDFPGSHSKFTINFDARRKCYFSLVNRATITEHAEDQRNILTLTRSCDLIHWECIADIINLQDAGWPEDYTQAAYQYWDWILEGDLIYAVSRTALNGAANKHDNNYVTFHKIDLTEILNT
jgi:hypothetical protein